MSNRRLLVWLKTNGLCFYCGRQLVIGACNEKNNFVVDHLIPTTVGGNNSISNLIPCCNRCNCVKGHQHIERFRFLLWQREIESKYGARFSQEQIKALEKMGFKIDIPIYVFWFELQNIEIDIELINKCFNKDKNYDRI
jgi:CRISPR/Cas system Type II protein with McrA/HNH and RuvC-like nuclease domain